jgi:hypothetical protein
MWPTSRFGVPARESALGRALVDRESFLPRPWTVAVARCSTQQITSVVVETPGRQFIRDINERRAELLAQKEDLERQLAQLEGQVDQAPNPDPLSRLPVTPVDLALMPDELSRRLFEALRLEIHYDGVTNEALCRIALNVYQNLGLRLTYEPAKQLVRAEAQLDPHKLGIRSVSEGGLEPPRPLKGTSTSS